MKTYTFNVVVEPDEERWYAECPLLVRQGAATWGYTREEALANIEKAVNACSGSFRLIMLPYKS